MLLGDLTADGQGSGQAARAVVYGDSAYARVPQLMGM
jgi:hypothetical protein